MGNNLLERVTFYVQLVQERAAAEGFAISSKSATAAIDFAASHSDLKMPTVVNTESGNIQMQWEEGRVSLEFLEPPYVWYVVQTPSPKRVKRWDSQQGKRSSDEALFLLRQAVPDIVFCGEVVVTPPELTEEQRRNREKDPEAAALIDKFRESFPDCTVTYVGPRRGGGALGPHTIAQ